MRSCSLCGCSSCNGGLRRAMTFCSLSGRRSLSSLVCLWRSLWLRFPLSDMTGWSEEQVSFAAAAFHIVPTVPYRVWTQVGALIFFLDFRQGRVVRKLSLQSQWSGFNYSAEADAFAYTCGNGLFCCGPMVLHCWWNSRLIGYHCRTDGCA